MPIKIQPNRRRAPARIHTRRLVATNEIHETDIRPGRPTAAAGLSQMQTFRRANKREDSGKERRADAPAALRRKEEKFEHLDEIAKAEWRQGESERERE